MPLENPARVVYGIVAIGALMAAESGLHDNYLDTIGSALIATALYWLAHSYADVLGRRLADPGRLRVGIVRDALVHEFAVVRGAAVPVLALMVSWAVGATPETAINVSVWSAIASLFLFEVIAALRSHAAPAEIVLEAAFGAVMALGIVFLKSILH